MQENCHLTELEVDSAKIVQHEVIELVNQTRRQRGLLELVVTGALDTHTAGPTSDTHASNEDSS